MTPADNVPFVVPERPAWHPAGPTLGRGGAEPAWSGVLSCDAPGGTGGGFWEDGAAGGPARFQPRRQRLYSAMIVVARGGELAHLFHASVAPGSSVVRERIRSRFGGAAAAQAEIRLGVDLDCPATAGLLPPTFRCMLERGHGVRWSAMAGFDVTVEHRVPS